nr:MAG TPA: hypothetical protein [Caudoviricetes sp.]
MATVTLLAVITKANPKKSSARFVEAAVRSMPW